MDSGTVQQFIDKARDLQAVKFLDKASGSSVLSVTVTSNGGKRTEQVEITKDAVYVGKRENDPAFYQLDDKVAQDLISGAGAIKLASKTKSMK